jgi:hypothetical protein
VRTEIVVRLKDEKVPRASVRAQAIVGCVLEVGDSSFDKYHLQGRATDRQAELTRFANALVVLIVAVAILGSGCSSDKSDGKQQS